MPQPVAYGDTPFRVPQDDPLIQAVDPTGLTRFLAVDAAGNLKVVASASGTGDVTIHDAATPTRFLVIDASGRITVLDPFNLQQTGTWGYNAGTSGTLTLTGTKRVLQITAIAEEAAASLTINAGDTVTIPYGSTDKVSAAITIEPKGNLVDPTIVFTATKAFFVEYTT